MLKDFELASQRHAMIKESFAALAARPLMSALGWAAKNPMKAVTGAFVGSDVLGGAKNLAASVKKTPPTVPGTFLAGPATF